MAEVVGVGIVAIDIIDEVAEYPKDAVTRASKVQVVAAQLGCQCHWVGTTTDPAHDTDAAFAHAALAASNVNCSLATIVARGAMPMSFILASRATGSRTIVHHRNLDELSVDAFRIATASLLQNKKTGSIDLVTPLWMHFEGRNMESVLAMMRYVQTPRAQHRRTTISVEIEALRYDWSLAKRLAHAADVAFVSKDYVKDKLQYTDATTFLQTEFSLSTSTTTNDTSSLQVVICPWGDAGVFYLRLSSATADAESLTVRHIAATQLDCVVDSIGAGDAFIGASVAALASNVSLDAALRFACDVATTTCAHEGLTLPQALVEHWRSSIQQSE